VISKAKAQKLSARAAILFLCISWGFSWPAVTIGLRDLPPFGFAAARFFLAAVVLGLIVLVLRLPRLRRPGALRVHILLGFLMVGLPYAFQFWAQQYIGAGLGAVLNAPMPLFVAAIAYFVLPGERATLATLAGIAVGLAGVAVIFGGELGAGHKSAPLGMLAIMAATVCWAVASVLARAKTREDHPVSAVAVQMVVGGVFVLVLAGILERGAGFRMTASSVSMILFLGIAGSALNFVVYYWAIKRITAIEMSMITFGIPVFALFFSRLLTGERLSPGFLAGSLAVLAGAGLVLAGQGDPARGAEE
jgi:drug/metabolite transporter (DMT)-like permease